MKKQPTFLQSLEKYAWKVLGSTPLPRYWAGIGAGVVILVIILSIAERRGSVSGVTNEQELIEKAASVGDYETARRAWEKELNTEGHVLGVSTELEELVYPERRVEEEIKKYERLLTMHPNNRDILLHLAKLCQTLESEGCRSEYWEQARILDPNNPIFREE